MMLNTQKEVDSSKYSHIHSPLSNLVGFFIKFLDSSVKLLQNANDLAPDYIQPNLYLC